MLANRTNNFSIENRNHLLASTSQINARQSQQNHPLTSDRRQDRSVQDSPTIGLQTIDDRLKKLSNNRSNSQQRDVPPPSTENKAAIFEGSAKGNISSNCNANDKNKNQEFLSYKTQNSQQKGLAFERQSFFKTNNPELKIHHFASHQTNNHQIDNNIKITQQIQTKNYFSKTNQPQNQRKQSEKHGQKIDIRNSFQQLIAQFSKGGLKSQGYREMAVNFLQYQIQKLTGNRYSALYQKYQMKLLDEQKIEDLLKVKISQVKILNQIIQQFQTYLLILNSSKLINEDISLIAHQILVYFMEMHQERNQELFTFYCNSLNNPNQKESFKSKEEFENYIVQKIEKISQELAYSQQRFTSDPYQQLHEQSFSRFGKQNVRKNGSTDIISNIQQVQTEHWKKELFALKSYRKQHKNQTVILKVNKVRNLYERSSATYNSSKIRSLHLNSFNINKSMKEENDCQIKYSVIMKWFRTKQEKIVYIQNQLKEFGSTSFSRDICSQDLAELIKVQVSKKLRYILKSDPVFKFSSLIRTDKPNHFEINVQIIQVILNNTYGHEIEAVFIDKFNVSELKIKNKYGSATWSQEINLQTIDFAKQPFAIRNLTVQCNSELLNKQCLITFYDLPLNLKNKEQLSNQLLRQFTKFMERQRNCRLIDIDFQSNMFTVQFSNFDSKPREVQRVLKGRKFQKASK